MSIIEELKRELLFKSQWHSRKWDTTQEEHKAAANKYAAQLAAIEALEARVAELEQDRERLDWLEETKASVTRDNLGDAYCGHGKISPWKHGPTAREAIDAARKESA